jgi:RNA polymerase sigma-70 factor (ECF subfamily)
MHQYTDALPTVAGVSEDLEREFERLLCESSTLAFRVAYSVLRQREDAEDVAQEAFIRIHRGFTQLRNRDRFRAWLVKTTWRLALDRQRSKRRQVRRESVWARDVASNGPDNFAVAEDVWRAIEQLPVKLRLTIVLSGILGHDVREVARLLKLPEGTVKSRLFLARARMKEMLR